MIKELESFDNKISIFDIDENGREINIYHFEKCKFIGELYYPNVFLKSNRDIYRVIRESTMSLISVENEPLEVPLELPTMKTYDVPVFFFVYNTDNYYHFIYDTLPYIISYEYLRKKIPNLKILMNYPNSEMKNFYRFVIEFLEILDIKESDITIIDKITLYDKVYVSSSYTHDFKSNLPPRKEIYDLYRRISDKVGVGGENLPKKIYISRRTWTNKSDITNIGTNYTLRRRLVNEDVVVDILSKKGYVEIFTENLTTKEKILLFKNAESVVGSIGGGMCNVLFSDKDTNVKVLVSPTFLDVNTRFRFCLDCCKTDYLEDSSHTEEGEWKKYMRVMVKDSKILGEVLEIKDHEIKISFTDKTLSGWNSTLAYQVGWFPKRDCIKLDGGLNSSWVTNLEKIKYL